MIRSRTWPRLVLSGLLCLGFAAPAPAGEKPFITVASTTSTQNSGLFDDLLPRFERVSGIAVRVVAFGTGAAIRLARKGDADVLIVHHTASELAFMRQGHGIRRHEFMYNDFLLIGPGTDPAGVMGEADVATAFKRLAGRRAPFLSRGDDSGTHKRELEIWRHAKTDPLAGSGQWYREVGAGMGATLNMAAALGAYTLADRGTWLSFRNRRELIEISAGDPRLVNQYGVILVNPARHPHIKAAAANRFIDWLISAPGQRAIAGFRINGQVLFHPGRAPR